MRVPVAVWQPCELLYTCYLLTYLFRDLCVYVGHSRPAELCKSAERIAVRFIAGGEANWTRVNPSTTHYTGVQIRVVHGLG